MLGTEIYSLILQFIAEDIKQAVEDNPLIRKKIYIGLVPTYHPSELNDLDDLNLSVVGKFKEENNLDLINQCVELKRKMYLNTSCKGSQ